MDLTYDYDMHLTSINVSFVSNGQHMDRVVANTGWQ